MVLDYVYPNERTVHSKRRILTPLKRSGPKGSGRFEAISWEEAIKCIKTNWEKVIKNYGAEAILPYSYAGTMGLVQRNVGHPFFYSLGASQLDRTICSPAKGYGWKVVMGKTMAPHPNEIQKSGQIWILLMNMCRDMKSLEKQFYQITLQR